MLAKVAEKNNDHERAKHYREAANSLNAVINASEREAKEWVLKKAREQKRS
jgi:hypothetical protein